MNEKIEKKEELNEPKILNPDAGDSSTGLPPDLWNSVNYLYSVEMAYSHGVYTDKQFREALSSAATFDDYYRKRVRVQNKWEQEHGAGISYDEESSLAAQQAIITNKDAIARFDAKIMEMQALAQSEVIDKEVIKKMKAIGDDIYRIINGRDMKK
jgi:hypothetical protein